MMGNAEAHHDGIVAFSQTDFTEDPGKITVPVLVMHGDDDQIVSHADFGPLPAKLVKNGMLKAYKGFPHGMPATEAETINQDLLAFMQAWRPRFPLRRSHGEDVQLRCRFLRTDERLLPGTGHRSLFPPRAQASLPRPEDAIRQRLSLGQHFPPSAEPSHAGDPVPDRL